MNDFRKILTDFAKHLNESGQLKKGTAIADEVKYYLENKAENLPISGVELSLPSDKEIEQKAHDFAVQCSRSESSPDRETGRYYDVKYTWLKAIEWVKGNER